MLSPSLGGNSKTFVICNVNPLESNYQETINTLNFGITAGGIKNTIKINVKPKITEEEIRKKLFERS